MTRRITKDDLLEIVPAVPATPYIPGYERVLRTWIIAPKWHSPPPEIVIGRDAEVLREWHASRPGPTYSAEIRAYIGDWGGGAIRGRYNQSGAGYVIEAYEIVPAVPATAGSPGYTIDNGVAAWNAGGSSISPLDGDGAFEFYTNNAPGGVVCGLVTADLSVLPHEATHAIKVVGATASVIEGGVVVHTFPSAVTGGTTYLIRRTGTTVNYFSDAETYISATPATLDKVYLDASLYLSGDYVDSPELVEGNSGASVGSVYAVLPAMVGKGGDIISFVAGVLPAMVGMAYSTIAGASGRVFGLIPPMGGFSTGLTGTQGDVAATLPTMLGVSADYAYSFVAATFPAMTGEASWVDENDFRTISSELRMGSPVSNMQRVSDAVVSHLALISTLNGVLFISDAVYDALVVGDTIASRQSAMDTIGAMLLLGTGLVQTNETDLTPQQVASRAPTQYAVNITTGALTTYTGYDFLRYATAGQTSFGAKADGVYRIRPGDDDGAPRPVYIDFGTLLVDSPLVKSIEMVNLAVDTDGQVFVRLVTGHSDKLYRVVSRQEASRAVTSRGVGGRSWNVSLEVEDSTDFVLDMVELSVATSSRRWASRG
jgi:hypothetical protein